MARKTTYNESTILYDITSMSVQMRKMVYNCATTQASSGRKVIASAGVDRVQEAFALEADRFADIFVNPNVDLAKGTYTNQTKLQARQYPRVPGDDQELDGGRRRVGLLERVPDHIRLLVQHVVLHRGHQDPSVAGRAGFSASTYLEPIMYSDSITGMKMAMGVMLWLNWESDADSRDIMKGRAIDLEDVSNKTFEVMGDGFPSLSIAVVAITATFTAGYLTMTLVEDGLGFGQSQ
ncbi:hypothetical protein HBI82_237790 [Parastagonospora nodorum]|nr:hypothetical protein HBI82_237790 [Parastagonospora nodorum]